MPFFSKFVYKQTSNFLRLYFSKCAAPSRSVPDDHGLPFLLQRAKNFMALSSLELNYKSFIDPRNATVVYVHGVRQCLETCRFNYLPESLAQLSHYRDDLKEKSDKMTFEDKTILRYKDELLKAVKKTLTETNFKP